MRKGIMWFPDSLVGKFVFAGAVLLPAGAYVEDAAAGHVNPAADYLLAGAAGASLGLLVFGAAMPFAACWLGMRQAGYGYLRCALGMLGFVAVLAGIAAVMVGIDLVGLSWVWGIGLLFLPLTIYDAVKLRRLKVVHAEPSLPEVRK